METFVSAETLDLIADALTSSTSNRMQMVDVFFRSL
jgi:hypothetical protein